MISKASFTNDVNHFLLPQNGTVEVVMFSWLQVFAAKTALEELVICVVEYLRSDDIGVYSLCSSYEMIVVDNSLFLFKQL